jgi:PQQ-dependent dehydrogenase (s-GDH family)
MRKSVLAILAAFAAMASYAQTPVINAKKTAATITVDGTINEAAWQNEVTNNCSKTIIGTPNNTVKFGVLWNSQYLYVAYTVLDANLHNDSPNEWDDDGVELYIDADNNGGTSYGANDRQFMKGWNTTNVWERTGKTTGVLYGWKSITGGYSVEFAIPWSNMAISNPAAGFRIGFDVANNDDDNGSSREHQSMWAGDGNNWQYPRNFGDVLLVDVADTSAPSAPANLAASGITQSSLTLSWQASTDNIGVTGYDIYRNGVKINSSLVTGTTYNVTGLSAETSYSFYVVARDAAGNTSAQSNTVDITIPDTTPPSVPGSLTALNVAQTSLNLDWNASTDNVGVTGYDVYQDGVKINTSPVTSSNYSVSGLTASTTYTFYVTASDAAGNISGNSNQVQVTTAAPPDTEAPTAPTNLVASNLTYSSVDLNWDASSDNIGVAGYDVFVNGNKANASLVPGTSYTVTGLTPSTTYNIHVEASDATGNRTVGETIFVTTPEQPDTQAPTAPSGLTASSVTETSLTLTWNASTDNVGVIGYDVYQNNVKINSAPVTALTYNVTGLTGATTYSFYIKAFDDAGNVSAQSNTINVTTLDTQAPTAPSNLASSNVTSTTLTLNWTAAADNVAVTGYDVYQNGNKINGSPVTGLTYNVTGLTASASYSFFVRARDAAGNISGNSNTINVTTPASTSCTGTGTINFQRWNNIGGTSVSNLTSNANYPNNPTTSGTLTSFEIPSNSADNYGARVYGYICPPTSGSYTFWIASDDNSELWLSTSSNATNKVRIAYHTQWTASREWNKYTTQKSAAITLTAGQLYYVEAIMKEGSQGDNMAVGWAKPGQSTSAPSEVIPGANLVRQIPDVEAPSAPTNLAATVIAQTSFTLTWNASTDNIGIAGYDVYRNGTKINSSNVSGTSYAITGLTPATTYSFTVKAKDAANNESAASQPLSVTTLSPNPGTETFTQRTVIGNQRMPHDLVYGPDNNIWYTERFAGRVNFVAPATGAKTTVLTLGSKMVNAGGQDGLMGLALHPDLNNGKPYVYIAYTYQSLSNTVRRTRIERYTYNSANKTLGSPVTILEDIPGSNDHNSARLAIGPDLKLYYSVGDMGAGQFDNQSRANNSQNLNILEGKILRLNTEAIGGSWIPTDNPFTNGGVKTAVYTYGHRNPQGLVWGNVNGTDLLYSTEHGPYSDDEVNVIESGRNYGWPNVIGFCDGNYNGRTTGGFTISNEQNNCTSLNVKQPLRSIFPASNPPQAGSDNMGWPSMAPSGTEFYGSTGIPGWQNSLLVAMLKSGTITRFKLSNDGLSIISDTINYFRGKGRFRDVIVSPDGLKIYVACDSSGSTSGPTGGVTSTPANAGSILEFTYVPPAMGRGVQEIFATVEENTKDRSIDVYPNPASTYIIVYNYETTGGRTIELTDMNGRTVRKLGVTNMATRVETQNLSNGLYVLRVLDGKGKVIRTEKVILQK